MRYVFVALCIMLYTTGWSQSQPEYSLFLVGDAGKVTEGQQAVFRHLRSQLEVVEEKGAVIFLGDNIYQKGLPDESSPDRQHAEEAAMSQIEVVADFAGQKFFIPGNHDWAQGRQQGWNNIKRQEKFIEDRLDSSDVFLPSDGCPGPVEVSLNQEITLVIIDTQWFLHNWDKPNEESGSCNTADPVEVLQLLDDILLRNSHKKVIIASHHPMYTYGSHGGVTKGNLHYAPPVLGSIYALYRKFIGSVQDNTHPKYRAMRRAMVKIFEKHPNAIHVAGHEHSLQYANKDSVHYIVSGSGSKISYVKKKGYAEYAESVNGYSRLDFYSDGRVNLSFWKTDLKDATVSFEKQLMKKPYVEPVVEVEEYVKGVSFKDSVVTAYASDQYKGTAMHSTLFGANYRDLWSVPLTVPVFDIGSEHGGLRIVQRGGGQQTKSLRLEAKDGKQYVLRSIEKYPENAVPDLFRNTFFEGIVNDQISASHPYGAFVVPELAEAAGIFHTNPVLMYVPDDPRFGLHRADFANTLVLYEERPAKDWSDADFFDNSNDIESTEKVIKEMRKDNDNQIDQRLVLKSRLFDMWMGDWDRHDDQWRWAEKDRKDGKGKIYRPIPRDRDQVFFVNEGILPKIWSRKWALPKLEGFDGRVDWPSGLMFNSRFFDRSFLTELSKRDWVDVAEELQADLTDEVIESAIKSWPKELYERGGETIIANLKARRERLVQDALLHYLFLSKAVDVVGSDKHEHFQVDRLENGDVHVIVRKRKKDGEVKKIIFDRLFTYGETKEIRLFGLDGEDEFEISGEARRSIRVRVIGGPDEDIIRDKSEVNSPSNKTIYYDTKTGNEKELGKSAADWSSDEEGINDYDRKSFKYNTLTPLLSANYNPDDGIFLGGGFLHVRHGFRKDPFKWKHLVLGSYALNTSSYNFKYQGILTDVIERWDFTMEAQFRVPDFTNNFFGLGNESEYDQDIDETIDIRRSIDFYRLRFQDVSLLVGLERQIGAYGRVGLKGGYINWELEEFRGRPSFVDNYLLDKGIDIKDQHFNYLGGNFTFAVDTRKDQKLPTYGIFWNNEFKTYYGLSDKSANFHQLTTSFSFYHSFRIPAKLTFASRTGYGINFSNYPFFMAQTLGGKYEIRGFRKTRFYGDQRFYNNFEVRLKLFKFRTYIFPASFGVLAFHDIGRVWLDGENSDKWHRGVGGGVWFTPFSLAALTAEVGRSEEETLFYVRLGFLF